MFIFGAVGVGVTTISTIETEIHVLHCSTKKTTEISSVNEICNCIDGNQICRHFGLLLYRRKFEFFSSMPPLSTKQILSHRINALNNNNNNKTHIMNNIRYNNNALTLTHTHIHGMNTRNI